MNVQSLQRSNFLRKGATGHFANVPSQSPGASMRKEHWCHFMQHHRGQGCCDVTAVTSQILVEKPGSGAHVRQILSISCTIMYYHVLYPAKKGTSTNDSHIFTHYIPLLKETVLLNCFLELWVNPQVISVHGRVKGPIPLALLWHLIAGTGKGWTGQPYPAMPSLDPVMLLPAVSHMMTGRWLSNQAAQNDLIEWENMEKRNKKSNRNLYDFTTCIKPTR